MSAIAAVILIFAFVAKEALPLLFSSEVHKEVTLRTMWTAQQWPGYDAADHIWQPVSEIPKYGIWPLIFGTLKVSIVAMLVAVPLGVGAAVYVSQYASRRAREIIKPTIELLAGVPSVVLGFFALMVMASWLQSWLGLESRLNALVAGVALSFAIIPLIFTISEEALGAVPRSYVEASTALGAARWQTIVRVLVPAASPGIAAARRAGPGPRRRRDDGRAHGLGQRRDHVAQLRRVGAHAVGDDRRRAGGGGRSAARTTPCCSSSAPCSS